MHIIIIIIIIITFFDKIKESIGFIKIFNVLGREQDLIISGKCCACVNVANEAQELTHRISRNFMFSVILTQIDVQQLSVETAHEVAP